MLKLRSTVFQENHPWETVAQAAWRKYPNPLNPNVKSLDVINRNIDKKGILHSHRLMTTQWSLPNWVNTFLGGNPEIHVNEHSEVNATKKTMTLKSSNITLGSYISIDEKLEYSQHPNKPNCTLLKQEAVIGIRSIPMAGYLEDLVKGTCSSNAQKGRQGMEWVIDTIKQETQVLSKSAEEQLQSLSKSAEEQMHNISRMSEEQMDSLKNSLPGTRKL